MDLNEFISRLREIRNQYGGRAAVRIAFTSRSTDRVCDAGFFFENVNVMAGISRLLL